MNTKLMTSTITGSLAVIATVAWMELKLDRRAGKNPSRRSEGRPQ